MKTIFFRIICAAALFVLFLGGQLLWAQDTGEGQISIDIPVKLERANVLFDIGHAAFVRDQPLGMRYMGLLADRMKEMGAGGKIIAVFYGDATYMIVNDAAYNTFRKVSTGNPYKQTIAALLEKNVQIEVCAMAMKMHYWTNRDLLPGVKVNSGAIGRIIQLVQEGYVRINP